LALSFSAAAAVILSIKVIPDSLRGIDPLPIGAP